VYLYECVRASVFVFVTFGAKSRCLLPTPVEHEVRPLLMSRYDPVKGLRGAAEYLFHIKLIYPMMLTRLTIKPNVLQQPEIFIFFD